MDRESVRVAICQPHIILGGRLQVILGIASVLNELGIIPDVLTFGMKFDPADLSRNYGQQVRLNPRLIGPYPFGESQDLAILFFNAAMKRYARQYDLLINSSNSSIFLPADKQILHYCHFPRERRLLSNSPAEDGSLAARLSRKLFRAVFRLSRLPHTHTVVCNSEFTRTSLREVFGNLPSNTTVIYPPVDFPHSNGNESHREPAIITIGRFEPGKRQLDQIKLARVSPQLFFHIVGFVGSMSYYNECLEYVHRHQVVNVQLHPNAEHHEITALLKSNKYFLHTLVNEPFGITAVQAMAAGCIPMVHDSGGQRETVPVDFLRYRVLDDIPGIVARVNSLSPNELSETRMRLMDHVTKNFNTGVFHENMKRVLGSMLPVADHPVQISTG